MSATTATFTYGVAQAGQSNTFLWSSGSDWNLAGSVPGATDSVVIGAGPTSSAVTLDDIPNATIAGLVLDPPGPRTSLPSSPGTVQIVNGNTLTVTGNVVGPTAATSGIVNLIGDNSALVVGGSLAAKISFDGVSTGEALIFTGGLATQNDALQVNNFAAGDRIDFRDLAVINSASINASGTLTVLGTLTSALGGGAADYVFQNFTPVGNLKSVSLSIASDGLGGTAIAVCFAAGTRIRTPDGEFPVEELREGQRVTVPHGAEAGSLPIEWIGRMRVDLARHPRPETVAPVRIRQGAFAEAVPCRDLLLSPEHCVFADGVLVPVKCLTNGMTIVQELGRSAVEYFHIETRPHAVILAEGLTVETYLDTGNRAFFDNAGSAVLLHPEFQVNAGLACWQTDSCAPLATGAGEVEPIWLRLRNRAVALGFQPPVVDTTTDPALHVLADGVEVHPVREEGRKVTFLLPHGADELTLVSRFGLPGADAPYRNDHRRLGVAIERIVISDGAAEAVIPADAPGLVHGWHPAERESADVWRWTDGCARVGLASVGRPLLVTLHLTGQIAYPLSTSALHRVAA